MTEKKEEIENYKRLGVNIIPINKGDGKAIKYKWGKYIDEFYTKDIPVDQDFGVVLGDISKNLIVLDYDECDRIEEITKIIPDALAKTIVTQTGDGYHVYLRVKELPPKATTKFAKDGFVCEVKSRGSYVIGAGCDHYDYIDTDKEKSVMLKTGKKYVRISRSKDILELNATGEEIIKKFLDSGWVPLQSNVTVNLNGEMMWKKSQSVDELAKGCWKASTRHDNGWKLAMLRFTDGWSYDEVMQEAFEINETNEPPSIESEVRRWVSDGLERFEKNKGTVWEERLKTKIKVDKKKSKEDEQQNQVDKTVDEIMFEKKFLTTMDSNEEMFYFDGKIYTSSSSENIVKETCENSVDHCTTRFVTEVINKIKRKTYFDRDSLNADADKIVVLNGILDISTGNLSNHSSDCLSTILYPVNYHKLQVLPKGEFEFDDFKKVLGKSMYWEYITSCFTIDGNVDWNGIYTLFEMMAYCLIKDCRFDKAMMLIGQGSNGKTVFIDFMQNMFGNENISNEQLGDISDDKFKSAELYGKTCNLFADIDQADLWKTGKLKMLISGDRMSAQRKHGHPFTFKNFAKMVFSANRFPRVTDQSNGFFRRFIIVEFKKSFQGKLAKVEYRNTLPFIQEERDRIFSTLIPVLNKMIERGGFRFDREIQELRNVWNKNSDPIDQFLADENEVAHTDNEVDVISFLQLHMRYTNWCHDNNIIAEKLRKFNKALLDAGYQPKNSNGMRKWVGMKLVPKVKGKKSNQMSLVDKT
jgi:putative DNA primase/helicase